MRPGTEREWRADDEIVERAKKAAARSNRSLNEYITLVVSAATDPEFAGSEPKAVRERLALAGLLEEPRLPRTRPSAADVKAAGERAASGTPLDELISSGR